MVRGRTVSRGWKSLMMEEVDLADYSCIVLISIIIKSNTKSVLAQCLYRYIFRIKSLNDRSLLIVCLLTYFFDYAYYFGHIFFYTFLAVAKILLIV